LGTLEIDVGPTTKLRLAMSDAPESMDDVDLALRGDGRDGQFEDEKLRSGPDAPIGFAHRSAAIAAAKT